MATHVVEWEFDHPPHVVWPVLADTARFNEASGLPKHPIRREEQPDGSVRFYAEARMGPFHLVVGIRQMKPVHQQTHGGNLPIQTDSPV